MLLKVPPHTTQSRLESHHPRFTGIPQGLDMRFRAG